MEAARSLVLSLPQAYCCIVAPPGATRGGADAGRLLHCFLKDTSLLGFISVTELMRSAVMLVSDSFKPFEIYNDRWRNLSRAQSDVSVMWRPRAAMRR
jgi:ABC-type amino acid transport system permease subunit